MSYCVSICHRCGSALPRTFGTKICPSCAVGGRPKPLPRPPLGAILPARPPATTADIPGHDVHEVIGVGGMGAVHRARQDSLQRDVALKISIPQRASPEDRDRFLREARVLAQLDHPNIVPIYDFGRDDDGRCYYTMKMVRGRTLKAIIAAVRDGLETWTLEGLLEVFRKACDAVAFAHARGVIHRDLKPENIMVGEFGEVLVVDWGLAGHLKTVVEYPAKTNGSNGTNGSAHKLFRETIDVNVDLTLEGEVIGTPQYMSPEQASAHIDLDERCDVYALGGILYSILTLRPPVRKGEIDEMLASVRTGQIEPFDVVAPFPQSSTTPWRIPPPLTAVVRKAMALERSDRFQTVGEFADDVDAHLAGYATSAEDINFAGQFWLLIKRHRTVSIAVLVLLMVSAGFVVQLVASERRATYSAWVAGQKAEAARNAEDGAHRSERAAQENEARANKALSQTKIAFADSAYAAGDTRQMRLLLDSVPEELRDNPNWPYLHVRTDDREALLTREGESFFVGAVPNPHQPGVFTVASDGGHNNIVDFDAKTGRIVREFIHRGGWVRGIAYSPDGSLIALARIMGAGISIHRVSDGQEVLYWKAGWADAVEFLPDGRRLFQSDHKGCHLWDVTTGAEIWKSPCGMTHFLTPDGQRIVAVDDERLSILSTENGRELSGFPLKTCTPIASSLSPDGKTVIVAQQDGQLSAFRVADGTRLYETPAGENGAVVRTVFTRDGRRIVTLASALESVQAVQLRDAATGRTLRTLRGGAGGIECLVVHPLSDDMCITGTCSATWTLPKVHPARWSMERRGFDTGYTSGSIGGFVGGEELFLGPSNSTAIAAIRVDSGAEAWHPVRPGEYAAAMSADGLTGVIQSVLRGTGTNSRAFTVFRASPGEGVREISTLDYNADARAIAVNCDGSRAALCGAWGGLAAYLTADGQLLSQPEQKDIQSVYSLTWHGTDPTGLIGIFTTGGRRGTEKAQDWLFAWDTGTGRRVASIRNPTPMNRLATEPGGTRFAEAGEDKLVRIRDANTLEVLREFRAHDGPIQALAWQPGGHIVATGSIDRSVRLWDVETGQLIEELHIGLREPNALYFSPSGKRLACVIPGERTLVWELE